MKKTTVMAALHIYILLFAMMRYVNSYSMGAPDAACNTMKPGHGGSESQSVPAPYTVTTSGRQLVQGQKLEIFLESPEDVEFAGYLVQAHSPNQPGTAIGTFEVSPDDGKTLLCGKGFQNSVTHKDKTKKKSVRLEWESPSNYEGEITFNATFVQNYATFWVGVLSDPITVRKRSTADPPAPVRETEQEAPRPPRTSTTSTTPEPPPIQKSEAKEASDPIYNGCNTEKLCFGYPNDCVLSKNCHFLTTCLVKGDQYIFELKGNSDGYVAVGLSDNSIMDDDSVVECTQSSSGMNGVNVFMSWNERRGNNRLLKQEGIKLLNGSYIDGNLYCKYVRDAETTVNGKVFDLANNRYYLLIASGPVHGDGSVSFHGTNYLPTASALNLAVVGEIESASKLLYKLHGAFMIGAWIGAASIGILLARYYKQTWVGSQMCGKDQWFVWHRFFMLLTWALTIAAFVLIFVEIGDWTPVRNPHPILGCVTTGLAFIQPIMALFRPNPGAKGRPVFNWLHWFVGNAAHIVGIVTIFFAVRLGKAELPKWTNWILVAYVAFHVVMHLIMSIAGCLSERQSNKRVNSFPMKEMSSSRSPLHATERKRDAPYSGLRKVVLGFYIFVVLLLTAALIVISVLTPIEDHFEKFKSAFKN